MHSIRIIKKHRIQEYRAESIRPNAEASATRGQRVLSGAALVSFREELISTSRRALTEQRDKDLAVFGTEGRLGELLCRTG